MEVVTLLLEDPRVFNTVDEETIKTIAELIERVDNVTLLNKMWGMIEEGKRKEISITGSFHAAKRGNADVWEYFMKIIEGNNPPIQSEETVISEDKTSDESTSAAVTELQNSLPEGFLLKKKLGSGQFGDVYSAVTTKEGKESKLVAVKFLQKADEKAIMDILDELSLLG